MVGSGNSRLLKILHIDPERNWGGGETQVVGLLRYLAGKGHRNHLLTHPEGKLFERARDLPITILPLDIRNDLDLRPVLRLRRLIRKEAYDIVHLHTKRAHALALWLPRCLEGPKYLVTRRMDYPESSSWYTGCLYNRRVDGVVAISQAIADLLARAGVQSNRVRVIPSGIDPEGFKNSRVAQDGVVVGTLAVLEERKGHRFLLEAGALLKKNGHKVKFLFAGDGPLRDRLQELSAKLNLQDEVKFLGFMENVGDFFSRIDIFALPSLHEGLGVAALEAMAAGKPVVATRVGGLAELVRDSVTGLLVSPGNSEELAAAIAKLLSDFPLAARMGANGAERVRSHFTLEQMAMKNEAYYYELREAMA